MTYCLVAALTEDKPQRLKGLIRDTVSSTARTDYAMRRIQMSRLTQRNLILFALASLTANAGESVPSIQRYQATQKVSSKQAFETLSPLSGSTHAHRALILLHGMNGGQLPNQLFEWKAFNAFWQEHLSEGQRSDWRLFVFRSSGSTPLAHSTKSLRQALHELVQQESSLRELNILAYSHGGLIINSVLAEDQTLERMTRRVLTMATVFHGTPTLTRSLVEDIIGHLPSSFERMKNGLGLNVYRKRFAPAYEEQNWDNFDGEVPESAHYTPHPLSLNRPAPVNPSKWIHYGAYFRPSDTSHWSGRIGRVFKEQIPELVLNEDAGLRGLNRLLNETVYPGESVAFRVNFSLNDGVTPLSSALRLRQCSLSEAQDPLLSRLFAPNSYCAPSARRLRVFSNLDHFDFRNPPRQQRVSDELAPQEESKELYDWVLEDLLTP